MEFREPGGLPQAAGPVKRDHYPSGASIDSARLDG